MKPGTPQLKSRQEIQPGSSLLERLNRADNWSQKPAQQQAAVIHAGNRIDQDTGEITVNAGNTVNTANTGNTINAVNTASIDSKSKENAEAVPYPWETQRTSGPVATQVTTFKIPVDLYQMLKFVAGSIPGESMTSILLRAVDKEVSELVKKLGYPVKR
jgi:hypothetical protein